MQTHGPNICVVRRGRHFSVVEEGTSVYLVPPVRQRMAICVARLLARANRSDLIVHSHRGRVLFRDNHASGSVTAEG